jgi:cytochrome P450
MKNAPVYNIDLQAFWDDPYPDLKKMRAESPVAYVPELDAVLLTRRDDIFVHEKKIDIFSSDQPEGLMTKLMGQNMMRKDGEAHTVERKAIFPTISPKTVRTVWKAQFEAATQDLLDDLSGQGKADMVADIAMRISGEALKAITGLTNVTWQELNRVSQGMIDGCSNYKGDPEIEARCNDCTAAIDAYITEMMPRLEAEPDYSLLSIQMRAGLPEAAIRANVKLAISGGQNEPRDAIAGVIWALLTHPDQLQLIRDGKASSAQAFEEYARWIAPVAMSPRRIAKRYELHGVILEPEDRAFLMFGSGNRDEEVFENPDAFDITRKTSDAISFGAGPHFCAGAHAARCLIGEVALPMLFNGLPNLSLDGETRFGGWAFRGPLYMPVRWDV